MMVKHKIIFAITISTVIFTATALGVYFRVFYEKKNGNVDDQIVLTLQGSASTKNYTLTEIMNFPNITGSAGYRRSTGTLVGPNLYKGVELNTLLADVGGINVDEELEVIASDGYKVTLTSEMLDGKFPAYDSENGNYLGVGNFKLILAYEIDGVINSENNILRIAALPATGDDYYTDGSFWVREVIKMKVISESSWIVYLYGITNDSIEKSTFEAFMHVNDSELRVIYQLQEGDRINTYEGLALWIIISFIDGELEGSTFPTFNDSLAVGGYDVFIKNSLEETVILKSEDIARNDSYILAVKKNTVFLKGSDAPMMLVGPAVVSLQMISGITEIWIDL